VRTIVVGAGLGGLSAACHLAGRGHEVVVIDREPVPGGRAAVSLGGVTRVNWP
jgi:phytoene desaturase